MTKKVTTIPALLNKQSTNQVGLIKKRRERGEKLKKSRRMKNDKKSNNDSSITK